MMSFDPPSPPWGTSPQAEEAANPYLRALTRHWLLILVVTLVTLAAAAFTLSRRTESYQATATVLVTPLSTTDQNLIGIGAIVDSGDPARNVETAGALLDSPAAAAAAALAMGRGWTQHSVQAAVSVTPLGQSNVISITATAPSPIDARNLANRFASAALAYRAKVVEGNIANELSQLTGRLSSVTPSGPTATDLAQRRNALQQLHGSQDPTLALASNAQLPTSSTGASKKVILLLSLIGGLALGCVAALLMERFSGRVRDEADVASVVRAPILAGVPKLPRKRGHDAVSPESLPPAIFEQFRLLRAQFGRRANPTVVMVTSADAGDGKTTVAASLAAVIAEAEQDVILLDLDLAKPDAANVFGITERVDDRTLSDWDVHLDDMLITAPGNAFLRVLPTEAADLVTFEIAIDRLPQLLEEAKEAANWVIVDSPPLAAVSSGVRMVQVCDEVLLVVRPGHTDRSRLILARDLLSRLGARVTGTVLVGQTIARVSSAYGYGWTDGPSDPSWSGRWRTRRASRIASRE